MKDLNLKAKYRLLVLMDLSQASYTALRNGVNLAKAINGSIEVFHVKPPSDVAEYENQLAAMRAIDEENYATNKRLQDLINLVSDQENIPIIYDFTIGNVKNEIKDHIEKTNPDIVVLGKRKRKLINFLGDSVMQSLLNNHSGVILIAGEDKKFRSNSEISIGFYGDILDNSNTEITKDLTKQTKANARFFSVRRKSAANMVRVAITNIKSVHDFQNTIEYEFEEGTNAIAGLANYISKNNVELLCIGRGRKQKGWTDRFIGGAPEIYKVIQKLNVPLLFMGDREYLT